MNKKLSALRRHLSEYRKRDLNVIRYNQYQNDGYNKTNAMFYVYSMYRIKEMNFSSFQYSLQGFNLLILMGGCIILQKYMTMYKGYRHNVTYYYIAACVLASKYLEDEHMMISHLCRDTKRFIKLENEIIFKLEFEIEFNEYDLSMLSKEIFID
jgi:hypothetical protein